jgi:hypothetical protein
MKSLIHVLLFGGLLLNGLAAEATPRPARKIWDQGGHNAFTDLIHFRGGWFCTFREATGHSSPDGKVRVLASADGEAWASSALLAESGIDLRDPKFSITPDGRLMLVMGGSVMERGEYVTRQTRVTFSPDGRKWTPLQRILAPGEWLWRVTWFRGQAHGVAYRGGGGLKEKRAATLYTSANGVDWDRVTPLDLPHASETTLRFLASGEMIALSVQMNPPPLPRSTRIGSSRPPYREWTWQDVSWALGGPNFLILPDGRWVAGSRKSAIAAATGSATVLAWMTRNRFEPFLQFVSGGDTSYPGLVWHNNELWVSFYSSHEGKANIYLDRVALPATP